MIPISPQNRGNLVIYYDIKYVFKKSMIRQ